MIPKRVSDECFACDSHSNRHCETCYSNPFSSCDCLLLDVLLPLLQRAPKPIDIKATGRRVAVLQGSLMAYNEWYRDLQIALGDIDEQA